MLRGFKRPLDRLKNNHYINLIYTHKMEKQMKKKAVATQNAQKKVKEFKVVNHDVAVTKWFEKATQELSDKVFRPHGFKVPKNIRINVSQLRTANKTHGHTTLGLCYPTHYTAGKNKPKKEVVNIIQMNIATTGKNNSVDVLDTLAHELIHAIDDNKSGHKKGGAFDKMARTIGLEGKLTSTYAGEELKGRLNGIIKTIGKFPLQEVNLEGLRRDTNRNLKVRCYGTENDCDHGFNTNRLRIEQMTSRKCLCCGEGDYHIQLGKKYGNAVITIDRFFALTSIVKKNNDSIRNLDDTLLEMQDELKWEDA